MPHIWITLKNAKTGQPITSGAFVSIQQDKWFETFKEIAKSRPDANGIVDFEATAFTRYRIVGDGEWYRSNEIIIDTGAMLFGDIRKDMLLEPQPIPTPDIDPGSWFRDVGLAQTAPVMIGLVAIAAIVIAIAYIAGRGLTAASAASKAKEAAKVAS